MDYMDPDVICSQKADKLNLSLSIDTILCINTFLVQSPYFQYSDVIMSAMGYQITVVSTGNSGTVQRKHQSPASLAFARGNSPVSGEFPSQRANNAENATIWWRHHDLSCMRESMETVWTCVRLVPISMCSWCTGYFALLVVNYVISNTVVLEIP